MTNKNKRIQVKGHTRLVYNTKKQKLENKPVIRIKKSHIVLVSLITAISIIFSQYQGLISEIGDISQRGEIIIKRIQSQKQEIKATTGQIKANKAIIQPTYDKDINLMKTNYKQNELQVYKAVSEACKYHGLDTVSCRNDLMGMAYAETRTFENKTGDSGKSAGVFQIHKDYHPEITKEQAEDIYWASKWTLRRMIFKGYKNNRDLAIMSHNGTPNTKATIAYLATVNNYINK